jgi:hypothetical protein
LIDDFATGRRQRGDHAGLELAEIGRRHFGPPLQTAAANQPEQFLSGLGQRSDRGAARRDHAIVRRQHAGLVHFQARRLLACPGRRQTGQRGVFGRLVLGVQLRAVETLVLQLLGPLGVGPGLGGAGFQFGDRRLRLGQFTGHGVAGDARQHLAFLDLITDLDAHLGDPVIGDLGTDHRLLPGDDIAVGRQYLGPVLSLRCHQADGQGRPWRSLGRFERLRHLRTREKEDADRHQRDKYQRKAGFPPGQRTGRDEFHAKTCVNRGNRRMIPRPAIMSPT